MNIIYNKGKPKTSPIPPSTFHSQKSENLATTQYRRKRKVNLPVYTVYTVSKQMNTKCSHNFPVIKNLLKKA